MRRTFVVLAWAMGLTCLVIGLAHVVVGIGAVPGASSVNATVDSESRFYGAIFAAYGGAWLWVAGEARIPLRVVVVLAAAMVVGGIGRLLSMLVAGAPDGLFVFLTVVELVVPLVILAVARSATDPEPGS